jgi:iron complex outermembrane receptor protein
MEQLFNEPVTESATGKPQRASDAPVNMDIITQDDIRRSGATSIAEALQFVSGLDVRIYGIADAEVGIRGYNQAYNPRLLVLVNGRQVYNDDYGHVSWSTIPVQLDEIRQIEVIKGPNSALYGFNAVSGVINIVTYNPLYDHIEKATVTAGTQAYTGGSAVTTAKIGNSAGIRLSAGGIQSNDFGAGNLALQDAVERQPPLIGMFNAEGRASIVSGVEASLEASLVDGRFAEKDFSGSFDTQFSRSNSLRAGLIADTPIGIANFNAYRNEDAVSIAASSLGGLGAWVNEDVYVVQASDLVKLGADHTVRLGVEYRNNAITSPGFIAGSVGYAVYAGSIMWDWRILPSLAITTAVRIDSLHLRYSGTPAFGTGLTVADYNRAGFTVASGNFGLVFQPTERDTLRLTAARGVQVPSLVDFGLQIPAGTIPTLPLPIAGNPNLRPSIVYNIEGDYERSLPSLHSVFRSAIFGQRNEDLIASPIAAPIMIGPVGLPILPAANVGHSNALGGEIGIRGRSASGLRWNLSYSFVTTTNGTSLDAAPGPINYASSVPRHAVVAGLGYTRGRIELDLMGKWQSKYQDFATVGTSPEPVPIEVANYLLLNARIGYRVTQNVALAVASQQFNRSQLLRTAGPPVERRILASITAGF